MVGLMAGSMAGSMDLRSVVMKVVTMAAKMVEP